MRCKTLCFSCVIAAMALGVWLSLPAATPARADEPAPPKRVLRVYADPNNLPFSNRREEGFENKIAELIAREMGAQLQYNWQALRQGFFRRAFRDRDADVVMGVPSEIEEILTTAPYYRSTYVFASRADRALGIKSLDDPKLKQLKIGVPIVGAETSNTPPVLALARRGVVNNVVGYTVYGDYEKENPPARLLEAVTRNEVDVAMLWGPLAGYFAKRQPVALDVAPVSPQADAMVPFTFQISIGVDPRNPALRDEINTILQKQQAQIKSILDDFGVPQLPVEQRTVRPDPEEQASH
jgi:quinoprotein dehydrogenase-associated probable ABC transporter substrate-binding protein